MPAPAQPAGTGKTETFFDVIFESAAEACIRAFLVLLLGSIAIGIVGDIFNDMTPTVPPAFGGKPELEAPAPGHPHHQPPTHWDWTFVKQNQFTMVASVFFVVGLWKRLKCHGNAAQATPTRSQKILNRFSEDWFSLIVVNAFGATIAAFVLVWAQQLSWSQICWHWLLNNVLLPALQPAGRLLLGDVSARRVQDLWAWYGDNQFRFTFWFLYFAGIANDLGLPNFKALGRWLGRRFRHRLQERRLAQKPIPGDAAE